MNQENNTNKEDQSKKEKRILQNYDSALSKAFTLLNGKAFKPISKISSDNVQEIMNELFKEEEEKIKDTFKLEFKELLVEKVDFERFIKQKEIELKNIILNKKEEFTKKINNVVSKVEGIEEMRKEYMAALNNENKEENTSQS